MKVKETNKKEFEPITIELIIETKDELLELWHRLNTAAIDIEHNSDKAAPLPSSWGNTEDFWNTLDKKIL